MNDRITADTTARVLAQAEAEFDSAIGRWIDWLRIPSISAQPAHAGDCRRAAEWAVAELKALGFDASVRETAGQPAVVAHHPGPGGNVPHLLYYGHYDVQPADPLELWHSPPFDPQIVDGPHGKRVVARGAVDDKGQVSMWLAAFRAWHEATGTMPVRISVLIEGEEEIGSPNLDPFVEANRDELAADIVVISDTGMWDIDTPAITTSLRGLTYTEVKVKAADMDLHSGMFGGSALNPINALAKALGDLHDANGRIQIPGFYEGVPELSAEQKAQWDSLGFDESKFLGGIGLSTPIGEKDRTPLERLWARPTADINGIWGGYQGPGSKTVIGAEASAKVSFRLVPGQDPQKVVAGFRSFLESRLPPDAKLELQVFGASPGIAVDTRNNFMGAARAALAEEMGREAAMIGCGGSIPVVGTFRKVLGLDSILFGFGLEDDLVHSPNEKFEMRCFRHGLRSHVRLLGSLAAG